MADKGRIQNDVDVETTSRRWWKEGEEEGEKKKKKTTSKRPNADRREEEKKETDKKERGGESNRGAKKKKKGDEKEKEEKKSASRRSSQKKNEKKKVHDGPSISSHDSSWTSEKPCQNVPGNEPGIQKNWSEVSVQPPQNLPSSIEMSCQGEIEKAPTVYFLKHLRFHLSQICNRLQERDFRKQMISLKNKAEKETKKVNKKKPLLGGDKETKGKKVTKEKGLKDKNQKNEKNLKEKKQKKEKNLKEKKKKNESVGSLSVDNSYFLLGDVITNQNERKSPENAFQYASAHALDTASDAGCDSFTGDCKSVADVGVKISKTNFDRMHSENSSCSFKNTFSTEKEDENRWTASQTTIHSPDDYINFKPQEAYEDISIPVSLSRSSSSSYLSSYLDSSESDSAYGKEESRAVWR